MKNLTSQDIMTICGGMKLPRKIKSVATTIKAATCYILRLKRSRSVPLEPNILDNNAAEMGIKIAPSNNGQIM